MNWVKFMVRVSVSVRVWVFVKIWVRGLVRKGPSNTLFL